VYHFLMRLRRNEMREKLIKSDSPCDYCEDGPNGIKGQQKCCCMEGESFLGLELTCSNQSLKEPS